MSHLQIPSESLGAARSDIIYMALTDVSPPPPLRSSAVGGVASQHVGFTDEIWVSRLLSVELLLF